MPDEPTVREMRLVVTATDFAEAVRFYRDVLGLPERAAFSSSAPREAPAGGRHMAIDAPRDYYGRSPVTAVVRSTLAGAVIVPSTLGPTG